MTQSSRWSLSNQLRVLAPHRLGLRLASSWRGVGWRGVGWRACRCRACGWRACGWRGAPADGVLAAAAADPYDKGVCLDSVPPRAQAKFSAREKEHRSENFMDLEQFMCATKLCEAGPRIQQPEQLPALLTCAGRWLHEQLDVKLQDEAPEGSAKQWDAGWDHTKARQVLDDRLFMGQAHICAAADALHRTIIVLQYADDSEHSLKSCGGNHLSAVVYEPSYATP
eukprot:2443523-Prymnesium_polylepis.1